MMPAISQNTTCSFNVLSESIRQSFQGIDRFETQVSDELRTMRDNRIFTEGGYSSFQDYCEQELSQWGGYRRVNQLLAASQVIDILKGTELDGIVKRESHARPLLRLVKTPEKLQETVAVASQNNPNPVAKDFRAAAEQVDPIPRRTKFREQLFPKGTKIRVSLYGHPRFEQEGVITADAPNNDQRLVSFDGKEEKELINTSDLVAVAAPVERKYPKEYAEAIAQLKLQHQQEMEQLEQQLRAGLQTEAETLALGRVREQLIASQTLASDKALEIANLQQKVEELESLRLLEVENQQLQQRIRELERALEKRPVQEWGNTSTEQAAKTINANTIKIIESLEPELHLRSLAISPPTDAQEALRLMTLAMGNLAKATSDTNALSAAAILLKCHPTPEAIALAVATERERLAIQVETYQAVHEIRGAIASGCSWQGFWAIAQRYATVKPHYWRELNQDERNFITKLKEDFDRSNELEVKPSLITSEDSPWLLSPQSWKTGGRDCKYLRIGELSLLFLGAVAHGGNPQTLDDSLPLRYRAASPFGEDCAAPLNDEKWLVIPQADTEKYINPRVWLDFWKEGKAVEGAIAHANIDKAAYEFHGSVEGVNPDLEEVRILWEEIADPRWYGASELRVREK